MRCLSASGIVLFAALMTLAAATAHAHSPRYHKARLVEFNRPLPAPGFALTTPDGEAVTLEQYRGKFVLLNFWATWCPPCVKEMPSMERLAQALRGEPFIVLGVSLDAEGAAKVKPFVAKLGVTFPIALDPDSKVADAYGATDLPSTFLVDPQGRVIVAAKGERDWDEAGLVEYLRELIAKPS